MRKFQAIVALADESKVIDIGGISKTWTTELEGKHVFPVTLLNLSFFEDAQTVGKRFNLVVGDALDIPFADKSFDVGFSNSVIEHVGSWEAQKRFASEISRVARQLWIQTPARSFPIEPHFLALFVHYLPKKVQKRLIRWFTLRGLLERPGPAQIDELLAELRLLTYREFKELFPDCIIVRERMLGITKSYTAVRL